MHLIVAIQEELPDKKMTGPIGDFVRKISSKQYSTPFVSDEWAKVRPREMRLFDFTIPEALEDEVMTDLSPFLGGQLEKLSKITNIPILKGFIEKKLGLKSVDLDKYKEINNDPQARLVRDVGVRIAVLGKLEDQHNEEGLEML